MQLTASLIIRSNQIGERVKTIAAAADKARDLGAQATVAEARRRAPVGKTRAILSGLQVRQLASGQVAAGVWDVKEASLQENGTSKMHAHPFMHPAAAVGGTALKQGAESRIRSAAD